MLLFSDACERNKGPILDVLATELTNSRRVVEIGSGTGQHAVHFAAGMPHLTWQPTDRHEYLASLAARIAEEGPDNLQEPVELDVQQDPWPPLEGDVIFSANTLHIMSWREVESFFDGVGRLLENDGRLAVYGPFSYQGRFTSESNARFDCSLRQRDPLSGIRDVEALDRLAVGQGLRRVADYSMPANNQLLIWTRVR